MRRNIIITVVICVVAGALTGGAIVYGVMDSVHTRKYLTRNREYKASISAICARSLARLRTGTVEDAIVFLEDRVDSYIVGVPMAENYSEMTHRCQFALAIAKVYRARFPFTGECDVHGYGLHYQSVPDNLERIPMLSENHDWLDDAMRRVQRLPVATASD